MKGGLTGSNCIARWAGPAAEQDMTNTGHRGRPRHEHQRRRRAPAWAIVTLVGCQQSILEAPDLKWWPPQRNDARPDAHAAGESALNGILASLSRRKKFPANREAQADMVRGQPAVRRDAVKEIGSPSVCSKPSANHRHLLPDRKSRGADCAVRLTSRREDRSAVVDVTAPPRRCRPYHATAHRCRIGGSKGQQGSPSPASLIAAEDHISGTEALADLPAGRRR
jgi:hypothetical protein